MPAVLRRALAAIWLAALAGCGAGAHAGEPTWVPQPSFSGEGQLPGASPILPGSPGPPATRAPQATPDPTAGGQDDPAVVATGLAAPDAIAVLPDNTALVAERATGRILRVQPVAHRPVALVRTLPGLDPSGGGGLLDLTLSPSYRQDRLVFAYVTTPVDARVVAFTLTGPVTAVLTGIPRGSTDNAGRVAFGADGRLYIGTSDAGHPELAADPHSLAGKVLRVTDIGGVAPGNPDPSSPVFTSGYRMVSGLCPVPQTATVLQVQPPGPDGLANVNALLAGASYGWPRPSLADQGPISTLPTGAGEPGDCAVQAGSLYVTAVDGQELLASRLTVAGAAVSAAGFTVSLKGTYGRLRAVAAAPDGALWLSTANRDRPGRVDPADERVLRVVPSFDPNSYPG